VLRVLKVLRVLRVLRVLKVLGAQYCVTGFSVSESGIEAPAQKSNILRDAASLR
jgi:hypothetical protein